MRSRPNKRNKDLWCHFHNDHDHTTDNCWSLKRAIEALIKRGQLRKFIAHKEGRQQTPPAMEEGENWEENAGTINNISKGLAAGGPLCIQRLIGTTNTQSVTGYGVDLPPQDEVPKEHGIGEVKGDQSTARQCYMTLCRSKNKEAFIIEHLREDTKMQRGEPVEDLVSIEVYPGEKNKTVRIGSNLKEDIKLELVNLLRTYAVVFAWTAVNVSGIDPEVITHRPPQLVIFEVPDPWNLYVDGSSAIGSSGVGIILISPKGFMVEYALRFGFQASNYEAEYEALLAGISLAHALKVDSVSVHSDSLLVVNHILGDYEARDERMAQYLHLVKTLATKFKNFTIQQIPRYQNTQADTLLRLASAEVTDVRRSIYLEFLKERRINSQTDVGMVDQEPCWIDMIIKYLSTVEIGVPTIWVLHFNEVNNEVGLRANLDLVEEART
ncbi:hypothetical protein RJ639_035433 [Escallonia herrerae]|uniref:RNase H type-1 domain-containing protein n=1 Tax=Escallonia herrerae TaxID=1293975 RepID=A0AA88WNP3_9ASTE|nr:hypothetical protein RJ639_035433 [Escallonia herrerae]